MDSRLLIVVVLILFIVATLDAMADTKVGGIAAISLGLTIATVYVLIQVYFP